MLLTWHNLQYYQDLMAGMRDAISNQKFAEFVDAFDAQQARGILEPL